MRIIDCIEDLPKQSYCLTVGTFDGVHQGHVAVLDLLKELSKKYAMPSVVFTFRQHPRIVLNKDPGNIWILNTIEEKAEQLSEKGIDYLFVKEFDAAFAGTEARIFISQLLFQQIGMRHLIIGHDHSFGRDRNGDAAMLESLSQNLGFGLHEVNPKMMDKITISSTKIRDALLEGQIEKANDWLGYAYSFRGNVIGGRQIGRTIGFPTANIEIPDPAKLIPQSGVYVIMASLSKTESFYGMMNIGMRPTFGSDARHIEAHLFGFDGDLYNKPIKISVMKLLRSEMKFETIDLLVKQLELDKTNSLSYIASL